MKNLIKPHIKIEKVEAGIFSALPAEQRTHEYDDKTSVYDSVIGHPLYNRTVWKNRLSDYADFCREALDSRRTARCWTMGNQNIYNATARKMNTTPRRLDRRANLLVSIPRF